MPDPDDESQVLWFSPDPRGLLPLDDRFHVSRRLGQKIRQGRFTYTIDRAFGEVMCGCGGRDEGDWINDDFRAAYGLLHALGLAHSAEAWTEGAELAGGVYGVALGGAFFAESMFHRVCDAGKAALAHLIDHLRARGFVLCDVQWLTPHLATLGAFEIPRAEYLSLLATALGSGATFQDDEIKEEK